MANLLEEASILLTPTAYDNGSMLAVKPSENLYGLEEITNGDFATDSNWTKSGGATISDGKANIIGDGSSYVAVTQTNVFTQGKKYKVTADVTILSGLGLKFQDGANNENIGFATTSGAYSFIFIATANSSLVIGRRTGGTAFNSSIDNISVKEDLSGDFQFSRNSAATRVNEQGLVENVQILSSNLVSNGDFSQEGVQEVSNGSFSQEGSELVTNGDFQNGSTSWILDNGWSVSDDKALCNGTNLAYITQTAVLTTGKSYKVQFDIVDYTSGSIKYRDNGFVSGQSFSEVGSYTDYVVAGGGQFRLMSENFIGSIDNVSVKEVGQDWTLGTGWSIAENKVVASGVASNLSQIILTSGASYKLTYEVLTSDNNTLLGYFGGNISISIPSTVGTHTVYGVSDGAYFVLRNGGFDGSITNISVKEVGQNWALGTGFSIGENVAIYDDSANGNLSQNKTFTSNKKYNISFEIKSGSGSIAFLSSNGVTTYVGYATYGIGTHSVVFDYTTGSGFGVFASSFLGGAFSITNISVLEITDDTNLPRINYEGFSYQDSLGSEKVVNGDFSNGLSNWIVDDGTSWTNVNNTAFCDGNNGLIKQGFTSVFNKTYKVTFDVVNVGGGELGARIGNGTYAWNNYPSGSYVKYLVSGSNLVQGVLFYAVNGWSGSIDNVSVKEYLGQEVVPNSGCGSWLLEPQSTNLISYSELFSDAYWTKTNSSVTSGFTSPSGDTSAFKLVEANFLGQHALRSTVTTTGTSFSTSLFCKIAERDEVFLQVLDGTINLYVYYNLTNKASNYSNFGGGSPVVATDVIEMGNGWLKIILNVSNITNITSFRFGPALGGAHNYQGDGTSGVYIYGAQLEQQSYATSYIPTQGAASTRLQDIANNSGNASLINSESGVFYAEIAALANDGTNRQISISNGSTSQRIYLGFRTSTNEFILSSRDSSYIIATVSDITNFNKYAFQYKTGNFKAFVNGVQYNLTLDGGLLPTGLDRLNFDDGDGGANFYGKTKALAVYKTALTDEQLTLLTTI